MSLENLCRSFVRKYVRLTILAKGLLLVAVPLMLQLVLIGYITETGRQEREIDQSVASAQQVHQQADRLWMRLVDAHADVRGFILTEDPAFAESYDRATQELPKDLSGLITLVSHDPPQRAAAESIAIKITQILKSQAENVRMVRGGANDKATASIAALTGKSQMDELQREIAAFQHAMERLADERSDLREHNHRSFQKIILIGLGLSLLLAVLAAVEFTRRMSTRVGTLITNIQSLSQGHELAPPVDEGDEIATVDQAIRQMAQSLAQSDEELANHTRVLQSMLDNMADGVVVADEAGKFLVFNRAAVRILGVGPMEAGPREWSTQYHLYLPDQTTLFPPEQLPLARALRGEEVDSEVLFVRNPEQSEGTWITVTARPLRNAQGLAQGGVAVFRDVTQRMRAEQERDNFFDLSIDILSIASADGYFKRINPAFSQILGWSNDEILARPFLDFVHPDDRAATLREVERQAVSGEPVQHFENRYQHKDGSWRVLAWRSVPQPGGLMYATARDVTDARRAEEDLRRSEQNLAITLDSIGDAVIATDAARRITRMNPVAEQMTGWTLAEAVGRPIDEVFRIIHEETRRPAVVPVDDVLATGIVHGLANHTVLISRDGSERPIADSAAPIRDEAGRVIGVVLVFRDVAEERQFERELQRLNAELEQRFLERTHKLAESEKRLRHGIRVLETLSSNAPLTQTLTLIAELIESEDQSALCSVLLLDESGRHLQHCAAPSLPDFYNRAIHGVEIGDGVGSCGTAAATRCRVIAADIQTHPGWANYRTLADQAGLRSCWSEPILSGSGQVLGTFAIYHREPRTPNEDDIARIQWAANYARLAIERERSQEQLVLSQTRFELLSQVSPVAIMFFDSKGKCIKVNHRWSEMSGITRQAAMGDNWYSVVHPEDRPAVVRKWSEVVRDGVAFQLEYRILRSNGEMLWVVSQGVPIRDEHGSITGFIRVSSDITEQKQKEQALRLLSTDIARLRGAAFFDAVVTQLAELLECEMAFVCRRDPAQPDRLVTLAIIADGIIQPDFSYPVVGTPCEHVVDRTSCVIPSGVRQKYPRDKFLIDQQIEAYIGVPFINNRGRQLGHLGVMSRHPLTKPEAVEAIAKLFAVSVVAEMERQVTERQFADLFEFSSDAIVITDRDGLIVQANRQVATVFGWTPDELVGQPVEVLMPPDLRAGHPSLRERYMQSALPRAMGSGRNDLLGMRKDGSVFPVDISLSPMQTPDGLLVAAAVRDVTERQKVMADIRSAATQLQEAKEFSDTVIENVSGLFYVLDSNGFFVRWNESLQCQLGLSSDQMQCTNALSIIHEVDRDRIAGRIAEVFTNGHAEDEGRLLFKDGVQHFLLNGRRLEIQGEVFLVGSGIDITDRKHAEAEIRLLNHTLEERVRARTNELTASNKQLVQASQFKSEFLASMSHELRTPLNGVLGMNELLLKTPLSDKQREFIDASSTSGRALLSLINDVLDISKIEAGKLELDFRACDLEALVYDVITMFSHRATQKGISLTCRLDPESCVTAMCDDNRLRQVLVNLLGNSLKFTSTGSVILESKCVQRDEQRIVVRLAVTDTGLGIPDDKVDCLFSPFSQVDSSTSRHYGGTGLGLSIARQLVELMGGTIGVTSRLGVGSTFWVEVPFKLVNAGVGTARRNQILNGTKVLAVDGVDKERRQIAECLKSWGCPFEHVGTLQEAIDAVAREEAAGQPFAVVLADCRLAIGDEFVHFQRLARRSDMPIIGLGVSEADDLANHLHQLGLRHLLRDPVRPSALFNALISVLSITPPTATPHQKPGAVAQEKAMTFSGHILVAEDNSINQMFVRELLKHCGCTCDIANNGDEALTALQHNRYDLALMDCQMPEMDGFTATREIRRREAVGELPGRLPIIALTANALIGDRDRCLESGMDDYLTKPLQAGQLQAMLAKFLTAHSAHPAP